MSKHSQDEKLAPGNSKEYLKTALEQMLAAGRNAREFGDFALERFGDTITPYLHEFSEDISRGRIKVKGLGKSAKRTIFGAHVNMEEREKMIREAAYLRAERRGFSGGSADEDWHMAEREIDQQLSKASGLVEKGQKAFVSAGGMIEHELDDIRHIVAGWLDGKGDNTSHKKSAQGKKTTVGNRVGGEKVKPVQQTMKNQKKEPSRKAETKVKAISNKKAAARKTVKET